MKNSSEVKRYESVRLFAARLVFHPIKMIPWAVITLFLVGGLAFYRQFVGVGILLSLASTAALTLVSLRAVAYLIWISADLADDVRAIRNNLESQTLPKTEQSPD